MNTYSNTLIQIIFHPEQYRNFIGLPLKFDAAEELLIDYWEVLNKRQKSKVTDILVKSGKYQTN